MKPVEVLFTRSQSGAQALEILISSATVSVVAALYRLANARLVAALAKARQRGVSIRLCLNFNDHYEENRAAQAALRKHSIDFRLLGGRKGTGSKMHHKFAVIDGRTVAMGSYNWTTESEQGNYENLVLLRSPSAAAAFTGEFEALWKEGWTPEAAPPGGAHA
ncbi:MAG TPA: phospholipase D family protein [Terriglobia bacterium]|nr:phospholipase D family protein [Terriglobia bacterium]